MACQFRFSTKTVDLFNMSFICLHIASSRRGVYSLLVLCSYKDMRLGETPRHATEAEVLLPTGRAPLQETVVSRERGRLARRVQSLAEHICGHNISENALNLRTPGCACLELCLDHGFVAAVSGRRHPRDLYY
jgi:hypothetical protein